MAIHFENYRTFSKGQGFIGSACRPISPQAKTARWKACDCRECKETLVGRTVISRGQTVGRIERINPIGVVISMPTEINVTWDELDSQWAPLPPMTELFGETEETS